MLRPYRAPLSYACIDRLGPRAGRAATGSGSIFEARRAPCQGVRISAMPKDPPTPATCPASRVRRRAASSAPCTHPRWRLVLAPQPKARPSVLRSVQSLAMPPDVETDTSMGNCAGLGLGSVARRAPHQNAARPHLCRSAATCLIASAS